jgi:hypothetical protein
MLRGFGDLPVFSKVALKPVFGALVLTQVLMADTISDGVLPLAIFISGFAPTVAPGTFIVNVIGAEVVYPSANAADIRFGVARPSTVIEYVPVFAVAVVTGDPLTTDAFVLVT